jgi:hypothetical protein
MVERSTPVVAGWSRNFQTLRQPNAHYLLQKYLKNISSQNKINPFLTLISYLYWARFNIIPKATTRFVRVLFSLDALQLKFLIHFILLHLYFLFFLNFITPVLFYGKFKLWNSSLCSLFICLFTDWQQIFSKFSIW